MSWAQELRANKDLTTSVTVGSTTRASHSLARSLSSTIGRLRFCERRVSHMRGVQRSVSSSLCRDTKPFKQALKVERFQTLFIERGLELPSSALLLRPDSLTKCPVAHNRILSRYLCTLPRLQKRRGGRKAAEGVG